MNKQVLVAFCLILGVVSCELLRMPFRKASSSSRTSEPKSSYLKHIENRYGRKLNDVFNSKLFDQYYGEISVGTPPQKFNVSFDLCYSDLVITSTKNHQIFVNGNKYDSEQSSTYVSNGTEFSTVFHLLQEETIDGFLSTDVLQLNGVSVNQTFGEITLEPLFLILFDYDGILGLGFNSQTSSGAVSVLDNLVQQGVIDTPAFSLYFNRESSSAGGEIVFGGVDANHYQGDFVYLPVDTTRGFWQVELKGIKAASATVCEDGCDAIFDSSIPAISGPLEDITAINEALGGIPVSYEDNREFYFNCTSPDELPDITITLGGQDFVLQGRDYANGSSTILDTKCLSSLIALPIDAPATWVLGNSFISKYYTLFDAENKRIGIAEAV